MRTLPLRAVAPALLLAALLAGCSSADAGSSDDPLTLLYTADAQGYLEACACDTGGELGGIARRAFLVDSLRERDPGTLLVEAGDFATSPGPRGEMGGLVAVRAMNRMGYDAVLPGEVELNLGAGFWQKVQGLQLPFVHTNFGTPALGPPQAEPLMVECAGRRIAVLGLLGTDLYLLPPVKEELRLLPPLEAAGAALETLEEDEVDLVVALVHMRGAQLDSLTARFPRIDVVVAGHTSRNLDEPERRGSALLVSAGFLGQHVGALRLAGPELEEAENSIIRIETTLPEEPEIARWVGIAAPG
ncbi:MAG: hypothetical protein ABR599_08035 [Gemmatimonadota bacterium]